MSFQALMEQKNAETARQRRAPFIQAAMEAKTMDAFIEKSKAYVAAVRSGNGIVQAEKDLLALVISAERLKERRK